MMKKDLETLTKVLNKHVVSAPQDEADYIALTTVTAIVIDLVLALSENIPATGRPSSKFNVDAFLRAVYGNDVAAASVKAVLGHIKAGQAYLASKAESE